MAYPSLKPASRQFNAGDYPVKSIRSQSGVETRLLYGNQRTGMTLALNYENIKDADAELFAAHYDEVKGTFETFTLPAAVRAGWSASAATLDVVGGNRWRYEGPPDTSSVRPGRSSVSIKLIGVL
jgi:hypothetical protein